MGTFARGEPVEKEGEKKKVIGVGGDYIRSTFYAIH
jgi:hypothetical protein